MFPKFSRPKLVLTDSAKSIGPTNTSVTNISADGRQIFVVYGFGGIPATPPLVPQGPFTEAQLFDNVDGKLISKSVLNNDTLFPINNGGGASPDFTRFVIVDQDLADVNIRIRTFAADLSTLIASTILSTSTVIFAINNENIAFTDDGQFFGISIAALSDGTAAFEVFNTNTLQMVASFNVGLISFTLSPAYFALKNGNVINEYFAFTNTSTPNFTTLDVTASVAVFVQFNRTALTLTQVAQVPLPQLGNTLVALKRSIGCITSSTLIGIGTNNADIAGEVLLYAAPTLSLIPNDGQELRIYEVRLNSNNILEVKLIATENVRADVVSIAFHPIDPKLLAVTTRSTLFNLDNPNSAQATGQSLGIAVSDLLQLRRIVKSPNTVSQHGIEAIGYVWIASNETYSTEFNRNDGKWLVNSGCKGPQNVDVLPDRFFGGIYQNVKLFAVDSI